MLFKRLYLGATSYVKIGWGISTVFVVNEGFCDRYCVTSTLFNLFILNMRKCTYMNIVDTTLYVLLFTDEQVVIASVTEDVYYMTQTLQEEWGIN